MTLTDEFCETFPTQESCTGAMCRFLPEHLSLGVDEDDPRVKQIQEWCRRWRDALNGGEQR